MASVLIMRLIWSFSLPMTMETPPVCKCEVTAARSNAGSIHSNPRANTVSDMSIALGNDATPMSAMLLRNGFRTPVNGTAQPAKERRVYDSGVRGG